MSGVTPIWLDSHDFSTVASHSNLSDTTSSRSPDCHSGLNSEYTPAVLRPSMGVSVVSPNHAGRTLIRSVSILPAPRSCVLEPRGLGYIAPLIWGLNPRPYVTPASSLQPLAPWSWFPSVCRALAVAAQFSPAPTSVARNSARSLSPFSLTGTRPSAYKGHASLGPSL